jgi:hypothetical protein
LADFGTGLRETRRVEGIDNFYFVFSEKEKKLERGLNQKTQRVALFWAIMKSMSKYVECRGNE